MLKWRNICIFMFELNNFLYSYGYGVCIKREGRN